MPFWMNEIRKLWTAYYKAIASVDPAAVEEMINSFGAKQTELVRPFLDRYVDEQFLRDYADDAKLLWRLNRVLNRVRLDDLPDAATQQVGQAREIVRERCDELLTAV